MGHGKNKQKQSGGFGKEPKETREQRRRRIAEEAKAREVRWFVVNVVARYLGRLEGARAHGAGGRSAELQLYLESARRGRVYILLDDSSGRATRCEEKILVHKMCASWFVLSHK